MKDERLKDNEIFIILDKGLRVIETSHEINQRHLDLMSKRDYIIKIINKNDITDIITFDMLRNKTRDI